MPTQDHRQGPLKMRSPPPGFRLQGPRRCAHEIVRERSRVLSLFIVRDVRPCGGVPAELCVKGPVRGGVPAELCVKGLVPEILADRIRARCAHTPRFCQKFFSLFGAVIFENLRVFKQFSVKKIQT